MTMPQSFFWSVWKERLMTEVVIAGRRVNLEAQNVLGSGGEGTVTLVSFGGRDFAVKVYHDPTLRRQAKLVDLQKLTGRLPPEVIAPLELAWDPLGRQVVGFAMRLLPPGQQPLEMLMKPAFREKTGINNKNVADLYLKLYEVLGKIHQAGMVVGDENSYNLLFKLPEVALIDADSYQFGPYPCEVATERFLNPRLYGMNFSLKPVFQVLDDWYSYLVLLFTSLLLVHPYGGAHRQVQSLGKRALSHITVLDQSVKYPAAAYPPQVLTDDLMQVFETTFAKGIIRIPDRKVLEKYRDELIGCPKCDFWYPRHLRNCPKCTAQNLKAMIIKVQIAGLNLSEIFEAQGPFAFAKTIDRTIYAVAIEQGSAVLYMKESLIKARRLDLFKVPRKARFDVFDHFLVVCPDPYAEQPLLEIYDLLKTSVAKVTSTVTERFGSRGDVFRGSARYLYRQVGGVVLKGSIPFGHDLAETVACMVTEHQSWFDVAADPSQELLCGFWRTFNKYDWFVLSDGVQKKVKVADLDAGEALVDRSVRFSASSVLILRQTRQKGEDYCRIDVVNLGNMSLNSRRVRVLDNPQLGNIHNLAFAHGVMLIPQTNGLLAENVQTGGQRLFPQTANYVDEQSYLWPFEDGVLVVSGQRVYKLVIK